MKIKRLMPLLLAMLALTGCGSGSSQKNETETIYEQYKDAGGSLSYEEWLKSIKGEKGDTGPQGTQGPQGIQGPQGTQGEKGNDGHTPVITIGANGNWYIDGVDSNVSAKGNTGETGPQGSNGNDGASAYDIYKKYNINYAGDEEKWINDFVKGYLTLKIKVYVYLYGSIEADYVVEVPFRNYYSVESIPTLDGFEFVGYYSDGVGNQPRTQPIIGDGLTDTAIQQIINGIYGGRGIRLAYECSDDSFTYRTSDEGSGLIAIVNKYTETITFKDSYSNEDIRVLRGYSFNKNSIIKNIYISKNMTNINDGRFWNNESLESIFVSDENSKYMSENGVLYSKDKKSIIAYPCNRETNYYYISDGVELIHDESFYNSKVNNLVIPSSVKYIGIDTYFNNKRQLYHYSGNVFLESESAPDTFADNWFGSATPYYYSESENNDGSHWHYVNDVPTIW